MPGCSALARRRRVSRSTCMRPRLPSPVSGSVRTCSSSALFSRSLIARRTITAVIVAAQSTVERPLVALKYCIAKRPIITAAKTAGTISSRRLVALPGRRDLGRRGGLPDGGAEADRGDQVDRVDPVAGRAGLRRSTAGCRRCRRRPAPRGRRAAATRSGPGASRSGRSRRRPSPASRCRRAGRRAWSRLRSVRAVGLLGDEVEDEGGAERRRCRAPRSRRPSRAAS